MCEARAREGGSLINLTTASVVVVHGGGGLECVAHTAAWRRGGASSSEEDDAAPAAGRKAVCINRLDSTEYHTRSTKFSSTASSFCGER